MHSIRVDWLEEGSLPILDLPSETERHCWHYLHSWTHRRLEWLGALASTRVVIPMCETSLSELYTLLSEVELPDFKTFYVSIRSLFQEGGEHYAILGVALLNVELENAFDYDLRFAPIGELHKILTLGLATEEPEEPYLKAPWAQLESQRRRWAEEKRRSDAASARALKLLQASFTEDQSASFSKDRTFRVEACDGKTYELEYKWHGNVYLLENERRKTNYCIVLTETTPIEDQLLGQKLLLETDIEAFLRIANARDLDVVEHVPDGGPVPLDGNELEVGLD